jgi:type II restriction enzyme
VRVKNVTLPEGPITIERYDPSKGQGVKAAKSTTISSSMLWRVANGMEADLPINFDRLFAGSYNTRSALETLLAHTPEFYWCVPGRIEIINSSSKIKRGHKHLIWLPEQPHANGVLKEHATNKTISELPSTHVVYDALSTSKSVGGGLDIEVHRRHLQVQIALAIIGHQFGYRTWIARNDKGLKYGSKTVGELDGVIVKLEAEKLLTAYDEAVRAALHIDCIWFRNSHFMPAVIEVEHSTGVTSGLARMKNLQLQLQHVQTRWVIAAPDEDRQKVMSEANKPDYLDMNVQFFPYSAVDELYGLCQRRKLTKAAIQDDFLNCFFEPCVQSPATQILLNA